MKKLLFITLLCIMCCNVHAQYPYQYAAVGDVINAYQYDKLGFSENRIIPLFKPISCPSFLSVRVYPTEMYFGELVKATEYPTKVYNVYYNDYGLLNKFDDGTCVYVLKYDSNGILVEYQCYDINTGKLIRNRTVYSPILSRANMPMVANKGYGDIWYTWNIQGVFSAHQSLGFRTDGEYTAFKVGRHGEKMKVIENASLGRDTKWFREKLGSNWRSYSTTFLLQTLLNNVEPSNLTWHFFYNELGLNEKKGGMTLSQCMTQGVRENTLYEYVWNQ